jgi:hypothetical protein
MALLIITSTVYINSNLTVLTDPLVRSRQYIDSILFYLECKAVDSIIICDNSNYDYSKHKELFKNTSNKKIELLRFIGDKNKILERGKGYGEGEIMAYIFAKSKLINNECVDFYKITGRIFLFNINSIIKSTNPLRNHFQPLGLNPYVNLKKVDTRFYHCTNETFLQYLKNASESVNDKVGYYLEHAYYDSLKNHNVQYESFNVLPHFGGISGSTGETYSISEFKWFFLKNIYIITKKLGLWK